MATTIHSLAYKITADTVGFTKGMTASRSELSKAKRAMKEVETPLESFKRQIKESAELLGKGAISMETHRRKVAKLSEEYKKATTPIEKVKKEAKAAAVAITQASVATDKATASKKRFNAVGAIRGGLSSFAGGIGGLAAGIGLAAGLRSLVKSNLDFQAAMAKSTAIMDGVTNKTFPAMRDAALEVARTTRFSASEAAEAYFFLASAGLNARKSIEALPLVAKFATAGTFDLSLATDLLTDAQSALGLSVDDAAENLRNMTRVADVLVKANTLANASVQQFSEALTNGAATAARLVGKEIEEVVAVLAVFADQGIKGAEAGTAFSIVMRDLQSKAILNAEAFKQLNIRVFEAGEMRNLADIVHDLEIALSGMSDEQKKATLLTAGFADKSVKYIQTLIGMSDNIRAYQEGLDAANGTTDIVASKTIPKAEKAIIRLRGEWERFTTSAGVTSGIEAMGDALGFIADHADTWGKAIGDLFFKVRIGLLELSKIATKLNPILAVVNALENFPGVNKPLATFRDTATNMQAQMIRERQQAKAGPIPEQAAQQRQSNEEIKRSIEESDKNQQRALANLNQTLVNGFSRLEQATRDSAIAVELPAGSR